MTHQEQEPPYDDTQNEVAPNDQFDNLFESVINTAKTPRDTDSKILVDVDMEMEDERDDALDTDYDESD